MVKTCNDIQDSNLLTKLAEIGISLRVTHLRIEKKGTVVAIREDDGANNIGSL